MAVFRDKIRIACYNKHHPGSECERWWCCYCLRDHRFYPGLQDYETKTVKERAEFRAEMEARLVQDCPSKDCPSHHEKEKAAAIAGAIETLRATGDPQGNVEELERLIALALTCEDPENVPRILGAALETLTAKAVDRTLTAFGIQPRLR